MNLPENDYQILRLTDAFYNAYPNPPYVEMLKKKQRAYNCLLFQTRYDYFMISGFKRRYTYSSLQYFHLELGLE